VSLPSDSAFPHPVVAAMATHPQDGTNPYAELPHALPVPTSVVAVTTGINPHATLPLAFPPPSTGCSADDTAANAAPAVMPGSRRTALREMKLKSALTDANVQTHPSMMTPVQQEAIHKSRKTAIGLAKKRTAAVSAAPSANGSGALTAELQHKQAKMGPTSQGLTTAAAGNTAAVAGATGPSLPQPSKRTKNKDAPTPSAEPIVTGPPVLKCEGCVHCDVLELKVMEPSSIRHYLKAHEFLAMATCAGDCAQSIKAIHTASPRTNLYYCDIGKKGHDAPDDDARKASMECRLVLCPACRATREERHATANSKSGATSNRSTRRRQK
jgi:hypothetical protein